MNLTPDEKQNESGRPRLSDWGNRSPTLPPRALCASITPANKKSGN